MTSMLLSFITLAFYFQNTLCSPPITDSLGLWNVNQAIINSNSPKISFSKNWQVLGPFRCGTREAVWGADPLEYEGGFSNLPYDEDMVINSALAINGTVRWGTIQPNLLSSHPGHSKVNLQVSFPEINWGFLQSVYGYPALQYQAWVRGRVRMNQSSSQTIALLVSGLMEFSVNGQRYFGGDAYTNRKAPVIISPSPGEHIIEMRLVRDVRASGGAVDPIIQATIEAEIRHEHLSVDEQSLLIPEMSREKLGSTWASINLQNNMAGSIEVLSIKSPDVCQHNLSMGQALHLSSYQSRPLIFQIDLGIPLVTEFSVEVIYKIHKTDKMILNTRPFKIKLSDRAFEEAQRLTYLHPARIVSYAILRPPPIAFCSGEKDVSLPVILGLHGAGLEADTSQVRTMLDAAYGICAWMLFPSGVTSWSGDDWHTWGISDVIAAVGAIQKWTENSGWEGPKPSLHDWIVTGHSNGGQGTWYLTTHYPDNIIAAAPVSGYSSIENYVPYTMWQESEPLVSSVLQRSRSSFKHELLLSNIAGIPILQQHGSVDDNVPVYHSRLMHELLGQTQWPSEYDELAGKSHWFDGVMTTPSLLRFYGENAHCPRISRIPLNFTISIPSSGKMASKGGLLVDQLQSPDINGKIKVTRDLKSGTWVLQTQNIHRFHLSGSVAPKEMPDTLMLDHHSFKVDPDQREDTWYSKDAQGRWAASRGHDWKHLTQRYGRQLGAMDAILHSEGPFTIDMCSSGVEHIALQISRNLLQYFAADSRLFSQCNTKTARAPEEGWESNGGNVITLALGDELQPARHAAFPIRIMNGRVIISTGCLHHELEANDSMGMNRLCNDHEYDHEDGMGAIFLHPLENERLELVVWGADIPGLEQAARLVPTVTGVGQPDFMLLSDSCRWKGHAGLLAAGHFDKFWQISSASYVSTDPKTS